MMGLRDGKGSYEKILITPEAYRGQPKSPESQSYTEDMHILVSLIGTILCVAVDPWPNHQKKEKARVAARYSI
jgi:hypothetical protein